MKLFKHRPIFLTVEEQSLILIGLSEYRLILFNGISFDPKICSSEQYESINKTLNEIDSLSRRLTWKEF